MRKTSSSCVRVFYPKFDKEQLVQRLKKRMGGLAKELPLSLVVLFGSYARGNYTVGSDVDLLVVYRGKEKGDAFETVKKTMDIPLLEPHVYSEGEYSKLTTVLDKMITHGIVLYRHKTQEYKANCEP